MASLSAGEVFVNLVIKGDGIKPTLASASAKVKEFGKGISAISVATGTLIAQGVTKALGSVASIGSMVWDKAKVNPKTAQGMLDLQRTIDGIYKKFADVGAIIIEAALPAMQAAADAASWIVDQLVELVTWLDTFGVVAALQTGDFSKVFQIAWKEIQIAFLKGSAFVMGLWDEVVGSLQYGVDYMRELGKELSPYYKDLVSGFVSFIGAAIGPIVQLFEIAKNSFNGLMTVVGLYADEMVSEIQSVVKGAGIAINVAMPQDDTMAGIADIDSRIKKRISAASEDRAKAAAERQAQLQKEIDLLREQSNEIAEQAIRKRDDQRKDREAGIDQTLAARASVAGSGGIRGTFALQASGGNPVWHTQKDILREIKEQKALQQEQVRLMRDQKGNQVRFAQ
jgi:hypothetical protein